MTWQRPLPTQSPETKPFWDAADSGRFIVQRCLACQGFQFPYRGFCCHCWTTGLEELDVVSATVFTYSTIFRNDSPGFEQDVPYVAAMVRLDDDRGGLMVQTNIVNCDPDTVHIGMPVEVTFVDIAPGRKLPMFTPTKEAQTR